MGIWFARVNVCGWVHARYEPKMIHTDWCNGSGWHMPKLIRYVGLIDSCSLRRETWLAWYSSTWKLIFIWAEKPWFLYTLLVWTIICCIYIESSWCHVLTIQTLPKVFLIYGDFVFHFSSIPWLKINQSSQSTTKVRQYKDGHVSTCVLGNEPNLLPPPPTTTATPHGSAQSKRCLKIPAKPSPTSENSILFHQNDWYMKVCPNLG